MCNVRLKFKEVRCFCFPKTAAFWVLFLVVMWMWRSGVVPFVQLFRCVLGEQFCILYVYSEVLQLPLCVCHINYNFVKCY